MSYPYHADHPNTLGADIVPSTPELPDVQQEDPALDVKGEVKVVNLVRVQSLPSRHGMSASFNLATNEALALLGANKRRRRVILIGIAPSGSTSRGFYVGPKDGVQSSFAALWPYGVPLPLENTEQIYVMPETSAGPLTAGHLISVISEDWAD